MIVFFKNDLGTEIIRTRLQKKDPNLYMLEYHMVSGILKINLTYEAFVVYSGLVKEF